jgi:hypothetical protein
MAALYHRGASLKIQSKKGEAMQRLKQFGWGLVLLAVITSTMVWVSKAYAADKPTVVYGYVFVKGKEARRIGAPRVRITDENGNSVSVDSKWSNMGLSNRSRYETEVDAGDQTYTASSEGFEVSKYVKKGKTAKMPDITIK